MKLSSLTLALMIAITSHATLAADPKKSDSTKKQTLSQLIKGKTKSEGLLNFYQDEKSGETLMVLNQDQLDTPFLYFVHTVDGASDAGHFRGGYRETKIIEFRRHFNRIDIITKTPRFVFDQNNPISKASEANISEAVLASIKIETEDKGKIALKINKLFLSEALHKVSPWQRANDKGAKKRFKLGKLDTKKSRIIDKRSFDNNVDIIVDYVFTNPNPNVQGSSAITDPRAVSIKVQHSFIKMPENNFKPRLDDARIGYFTHQFNKMTSESWTPYQDVIKRWDLEKKDPSAVLSDPVKPITWWIENTTPLEWRDTIKKAVLSWNIAFEKAGFKNAMVVKIQPDDATWDAGDINYNVLRWTASPKPRFGGYGPSFANPLTGQILGSDIMLEFVFMKNRWVYDTLYSQGAASLVGNDSSSPDLYCSAGHQLQHGIMLGQNLTNSDISKKAVIDEGLTMLILHEVGHTLGLNHNMKASVLWNEKEVHSKALTKGIISGSVMDYTPVNVAPIGTEQGYYFQTGPGPYDLWAIEYGYSTALSNPQAEQTRLETILTRSAEHGLAFGNDADDMRRPGSHIDPRIMISDMSSNPVAYAQDRMALINQAFEQLKTKALIEGESHQQLLTLSNTLYGQYKKQAEIISRQIGGVYIERNHVTKNSQLAPYTPVPLATQQQAMSALAQFVFAPTTLATMQPLYSHMQHQRRGFSHFSRNEDPKAHAMILNIQKSVLDQLLHKNVLQRISDTALYGNQYLLSNFMNDLSAAIFIDDKAVTSTSMNVQIEYVKRLIKIAGLNNSSSYDNLAKSAAVYQLKTISNQSTSWGAKEAMKSHKAYIDLLIARAFSA
ncbi:MAG: zinc-dependent metalloprotease [Gammaproteobacteria bacterium]|nr:zinc-dependent metalloprotease [Gammaproteobacteria bacterium]